MLGLVASLIVASGGRSLLARGATLELVGVSLGAVALAVLLWRSAVVSEAAEHASDQDSEALHVSAVLGISPDMAGLRTELADRPHWRTLLWREALTVSRLPLAVLAPLAVSAVGLLIVTGMMAVAPAKWSFATQLPVAGA